MQFEEVFDSFSASTFYIRRNTCRENSLDVALPSINNFTFQAKFQEKNNQLYFLQNYFISLKISQQTRKCIVNNKDQHGCSKRPTFERFTLDYNNKTPSINLFNIKICYTDAHITSGHLKCKRFLYTF